MGVFPVKPGAWVMGMGEKEMRDEPCGPSLRRSQSQGRWAWPFTGLWEHSRGTGALTHWITASAQTGTWMLLELGFHSVDMELQPPSGPLPAVFRPSE